MRENEFTDLRKVKLIDDFIDERILSERLSIDKKDNSLNYNLFSNLLYRPVGQDEFSEYIGFYLTFELNREKLGFDKTDKPGDFDILIIPFSKDNIHFERTCAIEVKVVRPNRKNPKKAPNSYGIKQIKGLVQDGFPLVGLLHICMTEPLKEHEKQTINFDPIPFDIDNPSNNKNFFENAVPVKFDHFSSFSAENQMKRLVSKDIPKFVGLMTVGVNLTDNGKLMTWFNHDFNNGFSAGYFNPNKKECTIDRIKSYYKENEREFKLAHK